MGLIECVEVHFKDCTAGNIIHILDPPSAMGSVTYSIQSGELYIVDIMMTSAVFSEWKYPHYRRGYWFILRT